MPLSRRHLIKSSLSAAALAPLAMIQSGQAAAAEAPPLPASILALKPVTGAVPIADDERRARLAKAQRLMAEHKIDAIYMDGGASLNYYTGMRWWTSERMMGMLLPASGDPIYITPAFERDRALEQIRFGQDIRTWQENESPYELMASILRERKLGTGTLGVEDAVPHFRAHGIGQALAQAKLVPATPVTAGCRAIKSPAEQALMQLACDATLAVYRAIYLALEPGMTQQRVSALVDAAYRRMGVRGSASVNVGEYTALPHGSIEPQVIREGTPVMLDGGCYVEGYMSDLTRTFTLGQPGDKMKQVFDIVKRAQKAALDAARPGVTMETLDAVARKLIEDAGYGPGYTHFTHRLGHGIGLEMHEWHYLVQGNTRTLEPGMVFSDEPGIYIRGEFGVRLEELMAITEDGARWFTPQSPSLEHPFG